MTERPAVVAVATAASLSAPGWNQMCSTPCATASSTTPSLTGGGVITEIARVFSGSDPTAATTDVTEIVEVERSQADLSKHPDYLHSPIKVIHDGTDELHVPIGDVTPCGAAEDPFPLITALRALQHASREGYRVSMLSIVCPTAVRSAEQDMTIMAAGLADIERFWPGTTPSSASATKTPNHALGRLH